MDRTPSSRSSCRGRPSSKDAAATPDADACPADPRAQAPAANEPPTAVSVGAPAQSPSPAVEGAPAPNSVLHLPDSTDEAAAGAGAAAAAAEASQRLAGAAGAVCAPASASGSARSGHAQPAWHWALLALGLVAFVALCVFAVMTLRRRAALGTAATTTYENQAFVGQNKAPAGAAPAGANAV